jgi:hypothetical protein
MTIKDVNHLWTVSYLVFQGNPLLTINSINAKNWYHQVSKVIGTSLNGVFLRISGDALIYKLCRGKLNMKR